MTDEKTKQLENRIDKLESTIEKMMPSRRDALKMGGAALVGGAAMSGTASAGTNQVGTIGSQASPVDLESEDINNADTVTTQDLVVNGTATGPFGGFDISSGYVDESNNRSLNTAFTNNKGPIFASVQVEAITSGIIAEAFVDGLRVAFVDSDGNSGFAMTLGFFVPSGSTFEIGTFGGAEFFNFWVELELS